MPIKKETDKPETSTEPSESNPKGAGRKRIEINEVDLDKLLFMQCTQEDCAYWFDCSIDTIERWCQREKGKNFADYAIRRKGLGKIGIRRALFQQINKGNTILIKFACETILGMRAGEVSPDQNLYTHPETLIQPPTDDPDASLK